MSAQGSSVTYLTLFELSDPDGSSLRMSQPSKPVDSQSSQRSWPKSGMTSGGQPHELRTLDLPTSVSVGLGLPHLPTLTASDGVRGPDLARANRAGSGTDDLVTFLVKRHNAGEGWGEYEPSIALHEAAVERPAPAPIDIGPRGGKRLSASFAEWLMGLPEGWVTDVPGLKRPEQIKALGNGVVPQQAHEAFRLLLATLDEDER